jgi:hypothetical protein
MQLGDVRALHRSASDCAIVTDTPPA